MPDNDCSSQDAPDPYQLQLHLNRNSAALLRMALAVEMQNLDQCHLSRRFLITLLAESTLVEEILDGFGARNNTDWYPFRTQTAVLKNFSAAGYELLHLYFTSFTHSSLALPPDFQRDTLAAMDYVGTVLACSMRQLLLLARQRQLDIPAEPLYFELDACDYLLPGRLLRNRNHKHQHSINERVLKLGTELLHATVDMPLFQSLAKARPSDLDTPAFSWMTETCLREQEITFHNLQAMYDTSISDSESEGSDLLLPLLREHISAILHLLRITTIFVHFYERHIKLNYPVLFCDDKCGLGSGWFFQVLSRYLGRYTGTFLLQAKGFCKQIVERYPTAEVRVPPPGFTGFHVRPSSLIAAIVNHYGGDVHMIIDDHCYHLTGALDLIRANRLIDQKKREHVFQQLRSPEIGRLEEMHRRGEIVMEQALADAFTHLVQKRQITCYADNLPFEDIAEQHYGTFRELLRDALTEFLNLRKINIHSPLMITFKGNKQAVEDIRLLARHGYGEDLQGNNIVLPAKLNYLNRSRKLRHDEA